jgi:hypothetical protein
MSTQFENYSVSEINFIEPVGNDLGDLGAYSLTLTPDAGYTLDAGAFNLTTPIPSGITNASFNQAGPNVRFDFTFANGTIMPSNDIEFPLCFQGYAELANFIIQGSVDISTTNATPLPQLVPYSNSGPYNSSEVVYAQTILADSNYYFFVEPTASLAAGDPNAYNITSSKTFGGPNGELTAVTFSVEYTYPAENVSSDLINIVGSAIPIIVPTQLISAFNFNGASGYNFTVNSAGAVRNLNLIGDPNAVYSVSLFDDLGNETVYATNQVMGATGTATIPGITIPSSAAGNPPYKLIVSGEINPTIINVGNTIVIDILQQEPVFIEVTATTTDSNLTIAGVPDVLNFNANTNYAPGAELVLNFSFTATSTAGEITQIAPVTADSFTPVIPDPLETDYIYNISNLTSALTDSNTIFTVSGTIEVYSSGATPITHVLDLDNILQAIPVTGLSWVTTVNNPCNPAPWKILNNNLTIRYDIENSDNCGGSCADTQAGTATATITVGASDVDMDLDFEGIGEFQAANFEKISFQLDGVEVARANAAGGGQGCVMGDVVKTFITPPPYRLNANTQYTLFIDFTTNDAMYHVDAWYAVDLSFTNVP